MAGKGTLADLSVNIDANLSKFRTGMNEANRGIDNFEKNTESAGKATSNFSKIAENLGPALVAAFSTQAIISFGKQVLDVTAEFQKLEAVLTNTLGGNGAARAALADITEFAATTPYSVAEASNAFLKLANSGLKPTIEEMRAFADLSANAGKDIDSMAEAINDASRGEFERLKEFFISARAEGDKYVFTFKNQTFEIERNAEAVKGLLVELGQLQGVAGATESISKTLTGQISNLGDTWDKLLRTIGGSSSGAFSVAIGLMNEMILAMDDFIKTDEQRKQELKDRTLAFSIKADQDAVNALAASLSDQTSKSEALVLAYQKVISEIEAKVAAHKEEIAAAEENWKSQIDGTDEYTAAVERLNKANARVGYDTERLAALQNNLNEAQAKHNAILRQQAEELAKINALKAQQRENLKTPQLQGLAPTGVSGGITQPVMPMTPDTNLAIADSWAAITPRIEEVNRVLADQADIYDQLGADLAGTFGQLFADLATGELAWKDFGRAALDSISQVINRLLAQAIASAIAGEATKGLPGLITAGIAAGGIAALFKSQVPEFANGGIVSGPTLGITGEYAGARHNPEVIAPLSDLKNMLGGGQMSGVLTARVQGRDLYFILQQEQNFRNRT